MMTVSQVSMGFLTYQIVEYFVLIVVLAIWTVFNQILVGEFRLFESVVAPIALIKSKLLLFTRFLKIDRQTQK